MLWKKQKPLLIFISLLLLFVCLSSVLAVNLEIEYPSAGGVKPGETTTFPEYVKYLFNFSIIVAGVIALGVMISSGIKILTSPDEAETIKDARTKIIGAFVGIVILLSSYVLLTSINPQLSMLSLEPVKPTHGVYLINAAGEKDYIPQSTPKIVFEASRMEFLSTKDELSTVYICSGENYTGCETKIDNPKTSQNEVSGSSIPSPKSIYFVWNMLGVYLYPQTNFEGKPLYVNSSVNSLSSQDFDNKAQSIKFNNDSSQNIAYGTVLFTDTDYKGTCGFAWIDNINNLSSPSGNYREQTNPIGNNNLSSLVVFTMELSPQPGFTPTGRVTVFDSIDCKGNKKDYDVDKLTYVEDFPTSIYGKYFATPDGKGIAHTDPNNPESPPKPLYENILSFEINGNFAVVLNTEPYLKGKCQLFFKPSGTNCVSTLVASDVYNPVLSTLLWRTEKVRSLIIIPVSQ